MNARLARFLLAEVISTFALVFAGCRAIMVDAKTHALGHVGVAISFGLVIMVMTYAAVGRRDTRDSRLAHSYSRGCSSAWWRGCRPSARTLLRRLAEGTTWRALVDALWRARAEQVLQQGSRANHRLRGSAIPAAARCAALLATRCPSSLRPRS